MKSSSLLCALGLLTAAASPAFAAPVVVTGHRTIVDEDGRLTRIVSFRDLDITTTEGERRLMRRVSKAVGFVCAPAGTFMVESACRNYAWRGVRPQLATALAQARTNPTLASATLSTLTISAPPS